MITLCKFIELPRLIDERGSLTFIENNKHIPFEIKRVYYLYDVPTNIARGGHAHKKLEQLIIPISGHFQIMLDDGREKKFFHMQQLFKGLYVAPMIWRDLYNFSPASACLVLASEFYQEDDYYRNYEDFKLAAKGAS